MLTYLNFIFFNHEEHLILLNQCATLSEEKLLWRRERQNQIWYRLPGALEEENEVVGLLRTGILTSLPKDN